MEQVGSTTPLPYPTETNLSLLALEHLAYQGNAYGGCEGGYQQNKSFLHYATTVAFDALIVKVLNLWSGWYYLNSHFQLCRKLRAKFGA